LDGKKSDALKPRYRSVSVLTSAFRPGITFALFDSMKRNQILKIIFVPLLLLFVVASAFAGQQADIYRQGKAATVLIVGIDDEGGSASLGSGFFVSTDGVILTNAHVIEDSKKLYVYVQDQIIISDPEVVAIDADADLALLRVPFAVPPLRLAVAQPDEGSSTIGVGYPRLTDILNMGLTLHSTVVPFTVNGLVQGQSRLQSVPTTFLQTVGAMYGGGSGGPLLDIGSGEVVGVMTQTVPYLERVTSRQGKALGTVMMRAAIAYSIPASVVRKWLVEHDVTLPAGKASPPVIVSTEKNTESVAKRNFATGHLLHTLALTLSNENDFLALAVKHYQSALQLSPNAPWILCNLGLAYASQDQWREAAEMFRQSLAIDPNYAAAAYHLGIALKAGRQHDQPIKTAQPYLIQSVEETAPARPLVVNLASETEKK
jgi:S1-C subfamily serine protease